MIHDAPLIAIIVIGLVLAFVLGTIAHRLKISPLVGYLLAGVLVGPFTPGYVADQHLASQLAEIGVILLMFGVGLHFSVRDLLSVRGLVVPGALLQMLASCLLGFAVGHWLGWPAEAGIILGLSLSIASTVIVMRSLQEHHLVETARGHVATGWLVFQDLITVVVLVLLPPLAQARQGIDGIALAWTLGLTFAKVAAFVALMMVVGRRGIPAILHYIAHTGSRELFRLAVLSVALGVAFAAAALFGVSFALGAFFAGMVLSESALSQRAAEETLPLRDAFAVLFFVSVGMLFDPLVVLQAPMALLATLLIVYLGGAGTCFLILRLLGANLATALLVAVALAQIGEFSFILADLGIGLDLLPVQARNLVLGASILSVLINPLLFAVFGRWMISKETPAEPAKAPGHAVLIGFGRVGKVVCDLLSEAGWPLLVVDDNDEAITELRRRNIEAVPGNAADERVLERANLAAARLLLVAIPETFEACQIVKQARLVNPQIKIIARAHFDEAVNELLRHGANEVIMGEREIANSMAQYARGLG